MIGLVRSTDLDDVGRLLRAQFGQLDAQLLEVEFGDHFIQMLRQHMDRVQAVRVRTGVEFHLPAPGS